MAIVIIDHPLVKHKLTNIRKKETSSKDFKNGVEEISKLLAYKVLENVSLKKIKIETPIAKTIGDEIEQQINLFPILRAGLGMVPGFETLLNKVRIGHIGIYRDEKTLQPVNYLFKHPKGTQNNSLNVVLDPMIATGGSAVAAINTMKENGYKNIVLVGIVGSKEGIKKVQKAHKDINIFLAAIDDELTVKGYIAPGLGDAGDRIFGTK